MFKIYCLELNDSTRYAKQQQKQTDDESRLFYDVSHEYYTAVLGTRYSLRLRFIHFNNRKSTKKHTQNITKVLINEFEWFLSGRGTNDLFSFKERFVFLFWNVANRQIHSISTNGAKNENRDATVDGGVWSAA